MKQGALIADSDKRPQSGSVEIVHANAIDALRDVGHLDLVVTDPPYAFGGGGAEHELTATVAVALRMCAERLRRGSYLVVYCASSWRSISYMVESVRGICQPVRIANWVKPACKSKVRTPGWAWATVAVVAMRKGPKNRPDLPEASDMLDWIESPPVTTGRRAQLPNAVADWSVQPFVIDGGDFFDPFAGSGALVHAAARAGMHAKGCDVDPACAVAALSNFQKVEP